MQAGKMAEPTCFCHINAQLTLQVFNLSKNGASLDVGLYELLCCADATDVVIAFSTFADTVPTSQALAVHQ